MDKIAVRLQCVTMAVQVATAESIEKSMKAPNMERVAELTKQFYDLVVEEPEGGKVPEETGASAVPSTSTPLQGVKKLLSGKDPMFS